MPTIKIPSTQRFILENVSWGRYTRLLRALEDRHLRMTYDRGVLEIMTLSFEHESTSRFLGRLVVVLTEEFDLALAPGGSTTMRRKRKMKGLEPDDCYWIAHEPAVRGKKVIDLRTDPPPDLTIEVDVTRSSLNRMAIYAKLRVPEVWRHNDEGLTFNVLNAAGEYGSAAASTMFPLPIAPADLMPFTQMRGQLDDNAIIKQFRAWLRGKISVGRP